MSIEKRAAPSQGPSDLNKGYSVASRPEGLSLRRAIARIETGGLS